MKLMFYFVESDRPILAFVASKTNIFQSYRIDVDKAVEFLFCLIANTHAAAQLIIATGMQTTNVDTYVLWDRMTNLAAVGVRAEAMAVLASEAIAAADVAMRAAAADVETNAAHMQTTSKLPTLTETSLLMNGSDSDRCDHTSCNCERAAAVAAGGVNAVRATITQIVRPAVLLRPTTTLTTPITATMCRPTSRSCPKSRNVDPIMAEASVATRKTTPETRMLVKLKRHMTSS